MTAVSVGGTAPVLSSLLPTAPAPEAQGRGQASPQGEPLGTSTHNPSTAGQKIGRHWFALRRQESRRGLDKAARKDSARRERWELRRATRDLWASKRVQACGLPGAREDGSVVLRWTPPAPFSGPDSSGTAGFSGLFTCGNVWLCSECSIRIAVKRAQELEMVLSHFVQRGGWAVLVTLTMRHRQGHTLAQCLKALGKGWSAVTTGRAWQAEKDASGYAGYARALEITHGDNGWHAHVHAVLVFDRQPSDDMVDAMAGAMFGRWSAAVQRAGMPAPTLEHGLDVQKLDPAKGQGLQEQSAAWSRYVTKGLAAESLLGGVKDAKGANRSIRQLMTDATVPQVWEAPGNGDMVSSLDLTARALLREYEVATKGRRQLTWSNGRHDLRAAAQLEPEQTDEEIAAEQLDGEDVAVIPRESWRAVEHRAAELIGVTERGGPDAGRSWLTSVGVEWWRPTGLTQHLGRAVRVGGT